MRILLAIGLFTGVFFGRVSSAQTFTPMVTCATDFLTTSYQLLKYEKGFELRVIHHNGVKYLPLHTGTITPNDLALLKERADLLTQLPKVTKFQFDPEQCTQKSDILWRCHSKKPAQHGNVQVDQVSFRMGAKETTYEGFTWESIETFLSVKINGKSITMNYPYMKYNCQGPRN